MGYPAVVKEADAGSTYEADCLFCHVDDASINHLLIDGNNFYVRWDNYPVSDGHVEVVPKRHVESFFELSHDEVAEAYDLMKQAQRKLDEKFQPDAYTIGVNDGRAAGRTVDHLHIHLIPRYEGDVADPRGGVRHVLPGTDPDAWSQQA